MTASQRTYETMNGLRGVAALAVMVFHTFSFFWPATAASGYLAVDFFFALSGFVVAGAYEKKLVAGTLTPRSFALKRLIRFYPLYLAGLLLGTGQAVAENLVHHSGALSLGSIGLAFAWSVVFMPAIGASVLYITPLNGPAWSLLFEYWVNLAWAPVARRASTGLYAAILLLAGLGFVAGAVIKGDAGLGMTWATIPGGVARTVFSFTAGVMIFRHRRGAHGRQTVGSVALLGALLALMFVDPSSEMRLLYDLIFALVLSPLAVFLASTMEPPPAFRQLFALLGDLSFPLYAIHLPLIAAGILATRWLVIPPVAAGVLVLTGTLAAAWLAGKADTAVRGRLSASIAEGQRFA